DQRGDQPDEHRGGAGQQVRTAVGPRAAAAQGPGFPGAPAGVRAQCPPSPDGLDVIDARYGSRSSVWHPPHGN
ncbi:hypothetical protein AB0L71_17220, partial [Streptomyces sp. NPDC052052]|uniref:hypothetical protein n=1 Tax=Streptomyces sp. NPDC052052 TaxID=3154756 RepID=UPI00341A034A